MGFILVALPVTVVVVLLVGADCCRCNIARDCRAGLVLSGVGLLTQQCSENACGSGECTAREVGDTGWAREGVERKDAEEEAAEGNGCGPWRYAWEGEWDGRKTPARVEVGGVEEVEEEEGS